MFDYFFLSKKPLLPTKNRILPVEDLPTLNTQEAQANGKISNGRSLEANKVEKNKNAIKINP